MKKRSRIQKENTTSMLGGTPQYQAGSEMQVATLNVTSSYAGADIEVDGMFVGSAPSTIQITPGMHQLTVRHGAAVWTKQIAITGGQVSINATFSHPATQQRAAQ